MRQGTDWSVAENLRRSKLVRDLEIGELAMSPIIAHRNLLVDKMVPHPIASAASFLFA